ncbi:MAG: type II secretion system protein [Planctomycetota bacterium]|nr:type II secretion system protein [Planctomycetota bacterium]
MTLEPDRISAEPRRVPQSRIRGFTMIELIVTLGIMSALVALVSTGIASASTMARSTACRANLRQLHLAAEAYLTTQGGYPAAVLYRMEEGDVRTTSWDFDHRGDGTIDKGPIWNYLDDQDRVFQCPDFRGASNFGDDPSTGYNYNTSFVGAEGRFPTLDPDGRLLEGWDHCRRAVPAAAHRRPSTTALFGDGGWIAGANKFMRAPSNIVEVDLGLVHGGTQAFRHASCSNFVCLDGHIECCDMPCEGVNQHEGFLRTITDFPRNGFLSNDDSNYDPR